MGKGYLDKFVDYLVGDGPSNRYALICKQCQSHNGMALREEFEFIAYRCCYCHYWNPARKQRPTAPRLEASALKQQISTESSSSEEEESESRAKESESASDSKETSKDIEKPAKAPEETVSKNSSEANTSEEEEKEKENAD